MNLSKNSYFNKTNGITLTPHKVTAIIEKQTKINEVLKGHQKIKIKRKETVILKLFNKIKYTTFEIYTTMQYKQPSLAGTHLQSLSIFKLQVISNNQFFIFESCCDDFADTDYMIGNTLNTHVKLVWRSIQNAGQTTSQIQYDEDNKYHNKYYFKITTHLTKCMHFDTVTSIPQYSQ
ncbi:Hypothetical_protein [Hexamita inflata]|uniref:Hypothetical_protein n=1 Tax=Hexamita inflata TaxID=28002 RepID=A0ABP1IK34_9EUKA